MKTTILSVTRLAMAALLFVLAGCGGGGGGGDGNAAGGGQTTGVCTSADTVECALNDLGVDTTVTKREVRIDATTTETLPENYAPLGSAATVNKFDEMFALGFKSAAVGVTNAAWVSELVPGSNNTFTTGVLFNSAAATTPWTGASYARAGTAADLDGDGRQELIVVYRDTSRTDNFVELVVINDAVDGFAISQPLRLSSLNATNFEIKAGDFDGDGDVAVGMMQAGMATLLFLQNSNGVLGVSGNTNNPITYLSEVFFPFIQIAFETGNLDFDNPQELVVSINEYNNDWGTTPSDGVARYYVYDDASTNFALLRSGNISATLPTGTVGAKIGDVAVGDVDGDGVDEVIIAGLSAIGRECGLTTSYVVAALDDAKHGFALLRAAAIPYQQIQGSCASGTNRQFNYLHLNTADIDGDGAKEIQANELILEDLRQDAGNPVWTIAQRIPKDALLFRAQGGNSGSGWFNWRTSTMAAGDVTSDEREDIVFYSQSDFGSTIGQLPARIQVWGLDQINGWSRIHQIEVDFANSQTGLRPQIIPANVNNDSLALKYSDGSYRLVFTEPLIVAALAAAPCSASFGQDLGDCRTAFGKGTSSTVTTETAWSLTVGTSAGYEGEFSVFGIGIGVEAVQSVETSLRKFTENTYTLTKRVVRTTGPIEDSVIFTTVPLDLYTYKILSHPEPELVGAEIQVRMPREPITIMVDRDFYNDKVEEGSLKVDSRIFIHTEGDPFSYPDLAARNSLLTQFDGVSANEVDVGQGTGFVTTEVNIFEQVTNGESYSLEMSLDVKATAGGVIAGAKIGGGVDAMISYGRGSESIYQGSVAQLPASNFPQDAYRYGLFSYVYEDLASRQQFEVVNYWVRPQL